MSGMPATTASRVSIAAPRFVLEDKSLKRSTASASVEYSMTFRSAKRGRSTTLVAQKSKPTLLCGATGCSNSNAARRKKLGRAVDKVFGSATQSVRSEEHTTEH